MIYGVLVGIHILVCVFLVIVVLLQSGKAADLAGAFGGMGSQTAFGPRGSATLLSKATTIARFCSWSPRCRCRSWPRAARRLRHARSWRSAGEAVSPEAVPARGRSAPARTPAPAAPAASSAATAGASEEEVRFCTTRRWRNWQTH